MGCLRWVFSIQRYTKRVWEVAVTRQAFTTTSPPATTAVRRIFPAVAGYDLCTGWGTPRGQQLINAIVPPDSLVISPNTGFAANGAVGGPFNVTAQNFTLTNVSAGALTWSVGNPATWLLSTSSVMAGCWRRDRSRT